MQALRLKSVQAHLRFHHLPGTGDPLVFLHGLGCASSCDYGRIIADAALQGQHAVLVDFLGAGFSDRPDDFAYTTTAHAQTIVELIEGLSLENVVLFGHSMGGSIAIEVAAASKKVQRLILGEPNLDAGGGMFSQAIAGQTETNFVTDGHQALIHHELEQGNPIWAGSLGTWSAAALHRSATSLVQGSTPSWREHLAALTIPRSIVFGERSLPDPDVQALPELGVHVAVVRDAGHSMAWENPSGLAVAIKSEMMRKP